MVSKEGKNTYPIPYAYPFWNPNLYNLFKLYIHTYILLIIDVRRTHTERGILGNFKSHDFYKMLVYIPILQDLLLSFAALPYIHTYSNENASI